MFRIRLNCAKANEFKTTVKTDNALWCRSSTNATIVFDCYRTKTKQHNDEKIKISNYCEASCIGSRHGRLLNLLDPFVSIDSFRNLKLIKVKLKMFNQLTISEIRQMLFPNFVSF